MLCTLRHGRGVHTCANGDRYEGQWRYDRRDGTGKMTFVRGLKYEGEWKDDKAHGCGAGLAQAGLHAGRGERTLCIVPATALAYITPPPPPSSSHWQMCCQPPSCCRPRPPCRSSAAQYENGGVFVGEFREDHRWGWGTHYFPGGDKYEGEWEDDKISGESDCMGQAGRLPGWMARLDGQAGSQLPA